MTEHVPFWYVNHAAWRQYQDALAAVVPWPQSAPRKDARTYRLVVETARELGVLHGPCGLRITSAATTPGLPSNRLPYGPGDPLTPHLTVTTSTGWSIVVQVADITAADRDPGDDPYQVAFDIINTVALDITLALVDNHPDVAAEYQRVVHDPQTLHRAPERSAASLPTPSSWTKKGHVQADALEGLFRAALNSGSLTLPATVELATFRDASRGRVGMNVTLSDLIPDVKTVSFNISTPTLPAPTGGPADQAALCNVLDWFADWYDDNAWHQGVVLPGPAQPPLTV